MQKKSYAIFLDIDNTLMADGAVPEPNVIAIKKARENGHFVLINTARSYAFLPEGLLEKVETDGIVAGIGTDIRVRGERLVSEVMDRDELSFIAEHFLGLNREVAFEGEDEILWINPGSDRNARLLVKAPEDFYGCYADARISKMYVKGALTDEEKELFGEKYDLFVHSYYSEFVPKGFGKGRGMLIAAKRLGVPLGRCVAMGDSANDLDMLLKAGISVAMGNAVDSVKRACDFVSKSASQAGVAYALERLLGI